MMMSPEKRDQRRERVRADVVAGRPVSPWMLWRYAADLVNAPGWLDDLMRKRRGNRTRARAEQIRAEILELARAIRG